MNFFEQQAQQRRSTRRLVLLFLMSLTIVVGAISSLLVGVLAALQKDSPWQDGNVLPDGGWLAAHTGLVVVSVCLVLGVIIAASLYKAATLSEGGPALARAAGGERVPRDTQDPQLRQLLNVVEEIAIASGLPVPNVYVLPHETGINAFAAGYNPSNAAITVTRGTLALLDRNELQGVIAHEFSHVVNGDMRISLRLISLLFGLTVVASIARLIMRFTPRLGGDDRRSGGALAALFGVAAVLYVLGYIGLFFGRMIQAAVSRRRESLADASAVQFTRDPLGLRGALVKIGATSTGSRLIETDADDVAHMLFAPGMPRLFATHPPLAERIRAIDPSFRESEFARVSGSLAARLAELEPPSPPASARTRLQQLLQGALPLQAASVPALVGQFSEQQIALARALRVTLPAEVLAAAEHGDDAIALLSALALDQEGVLREQQLLFLGHQMGEAAAVRCRALLPVVDALNPMQRQPALLRLMPALRTLPAAQRALLIQTLNGMMQRGGRLSLRQFTLRKMLQVQLRDIGLTRPIGGGLTLTGALEDCRLLLSAVALQGSTDTLAARNAYAAGLAALGNEPAIAPRLADDWPQRLDLALSRLDRLAPAGKQRLVLALMATICSDGQVTAAEAELLRTTCACLHCPLPLGLEDTSRQ